ncbi:MAG: hypothetical protein ACNA8J_03415 [Gammaproteobacteria bacterium]
MPKRLPYRATTSTGNQFEFDFPLHPETVSAVNVFNLINVLLATLDREIHQTGPMSNSDVLQALALTLAIRTRILPGDPVQLARLAASLLNEGLVAPVTGAEGNLPPDEPREVH